MSKTPREEFLINMYQQLMADINRHIMVVWQSIATVGGSIVFFTWSSNGSLAIEYAVSLVIFVGFWQLLHVLDSNYWYNRNLVIIANIERQFLKKSDETTIHHYFVEHRKKNSLIDHLKIQFFLGVGVILFSVVYYWIEKKAAGGEFFNCSFKDALPLIFLFSGGIYTIHFWKDRENSYQKFKEKSPGLSNLNE